ncbi:PHP domain-containing protein [Bailinhaonella thermotolerans]|uniref:PHP domain-containing protein n=1 Tax=Bailinhaonella thermotolerans TaxID=1070861 RepID=A0A3A4B2N8_9ACTN|nr:CehA/McbA family metallohydrolase [Bailinhaonella thermotolerans]RJL34448.1 PHP domain-containing protein [Bailinhaonella thermotolerans]
MTSRERRHHGRWTLADRAERMLRELPVEVPPGTAALTVRLAYPRAAGVLDLGCQGPYGFRGWSGGARETFTVAAGWATPGYLPGELEPGVWHVLLSLHRVPPGGLEYELTAVVSDRAPAAPETAWPDPAERPPRRDLPAPGGLRWLAGDLHTHTVHSDGRLTVPELARLAASRGLDYLAVTDHNTVSHHPHLPAAASRYGVALIPGQELTTDFGHANVLGPGGRIDFRLPAGEWVRQAGENGALISINHPLAGECAWLHPLTERPRLAEVWHSGWWDRRWGAPVAWAQAWRPDTVAVGGSDFHHHGADAPPGEPATWVLAEDGDVLGALAAGRAAVSAGIRGPLLLRHGDELLALDADGTVLADDEGRRRFVRGNKVVFPAGVGMHRLETYENEVVALCS